MPPSLGPLLAPDPVALVARAASIPSSAPVSTGPTEEAQTREQSIVEAWAQGFHVGAIIILVLITLCNYRRRVILHKLILLELFLALWHGTFIFFKDPTYGWYLSSTAVPLYLSYSLHNVISWMKIKPFLPKWGGNFFIISLAFVQPYWVLEMWANFQYFNGLGSHVFEHTRYVETVARDPWWIFTTVMLCVVITRNYELNFTELVKASPRFGVMLGCMFVSIVFLVTDIIATAKLSKQSGINPYWRLALVFKCASDTIFLDDFKSVLDRIVRSAMKRVANLPYTSNQEGDTAHISHSGRRGGSAAAPATRPSFSAATNRRESSARRASNAEYEKRAWRQNRLDSFMWKKEKNSSDGESSTIAMGPLDESGINEYGHSYTITGGPPVGKHGHSVSKTITIEQNGSAEHLTRTPSRDPAPVGDYEWAMAQESYEEHKDFERDVDTGIPMMPMRAKRADSVRIYG